MSIVLSKTAAAVGYQSRSALVISVTGKTFPVGAVRFAENRAYRYDGASTSISDMPGWVIETTAFADITDVPPLLTGTTASFTTAKDTKLSGIAAGATANSADATLLARANHTGTQAATTVALSGGGTAQDYAGFSTRAAFVTWASGKTPATGTVISAAGYAYRYIGTGTAISDLAGWVPHGLAYPDHFAQNTTPGTTDMGAAFMAALAYSPTVNLAAASYATGQELNGNSARIEGSTVGGTPSKIVGLSASIPIGSAILALCNKSSVRNVVIGYDTISKAETRWQRVGIRTNYGGVLLCRGASLRGLTIDNVGTAISDFGVGEFSVSYTDLDIRRCSYAYVDISGTGNTGSAWENIYCNGNDDATLTPTWGFHYENAAGTSVRQLNVEHTGFSDGSVNINNCEGFRIDNLHLEGVDSTAASKGYVIIDGGSLDIGTISVQQTRMTQDNTSVFLLKKAGLGSGATVPTAYLTRSVLRIAQLSLNSIAYPSPTFYPAYNTTYSTRLGVANCAGYAVFRRDATYTDSDFSVEVGSQRGGPYNATATADRDFYRNPDLDASGSLVFSRFDSIGPQAGRSNLLRNGFFDRWVATSGNGTAGGVELAERWVLVGNTGTIAGSQVAGDFGADSSYALNLAVTAGNYQSLYQDIAFPTELVGQDCEFSFEMKATVAGQVFTQLTATLTNAAGTPTTLFKQAAIGTATSVQAKTAWTRHIVKFQMFAVGSVTTIGAGAYVRLQFNINDAAGSLSPNITLRNINLVKTKAASLPRIGLDRFSGALRVDASAAPALASLQYPTVGLSWPSADVLRVAISTGTIAEFGASGLVLNDPTTTTKKLAFGLSGISAATTRTVTLPDASGTMVLDTTTQALTNKTLGNTNTFAIKDTLLTLQNGADVTKQALFQLSGITTGTTRTYTLPDVSSTFAVLGLAQTFAGNNTFSSAFNYFGSSTAASQSYFGHGATINGATKDMRVGTGGVSGSITNISYGSSIAGATTSHTFNGDIYLQQGTPTAKSAAATLTNAELQTKIVNYSGAAAALTMPLGSTLDSLGFAVDTGLDFYVVNTGSGAATMTANTGVTIVGAAAVTNGTSAHFRIRKTATSTYVLYRIV